MKQELKKIGATTKNKRNFSVNLLRNTKKDYFHKLNIKDLTDSKNSGNH